MLVLCAHQISVKASIVDQSVKYLTLYIVVPTCSDGVKNGNETDVDCGGSCLPTKPCREMLKCFGASDCMSGACRLNICQGKCDYRIYKDRYYTAVRCFFKSCRVNRRPARNAARF